MNTKDIFEMDVFNEYQVVWIFAIGIIFIMIAIGGPPTGKS